MRMSDWGSDVCSSDLGVVPDERLRALDVILPERVVGRLLELGRRGRGHAAPSAGGLCGDSAKEYTLNSGTCSRRPRATARCARAPPRAPLSSKSSIGGRDVGQRAEDQGADRRDRQRRESGQGVSVRVELGGRRIIKKK